MGEWWTYSLGDFLMFSPRAWYRLLALHNRGWWPLHIVTTLLGAGLLWAMHRRLRPALRLGLVLAGAGLVFVAWAFHWGPHAAINLAAPYFATAFAAEGLLLIVLAWRRPALVLLRADDTPTRLAFGLLVWALLLYPVLALVWARPLLQSESFALAPDPTMLATLALLLLLLCGAHGLHHPRRTCVLLLVLPLSWCAVTGATLWALGAPDWWLMPAAALLAGAIAAWQGLRPARPVHGRG